MIETFVTKNPWYYGGHNVKGQYEPIIRLAKQLLDRSHDKEDKAPFMVIHPLYVRLQKKNPIHAFYG